MTVINRTIDHYGYAVADLSTAAHHWATTLGAGPFFEVGPVTFESVTSFGRPCVFDHTAAFGRWGELMIELQQVERCSPPALAERLIGNGTPRINHVAYVSEDPESDSAELTAAGIEKFLEARVGEIHVRFHDARHVLGHFIEIHKPSAMRKMFAARIAEAARGWDGRDPLRKISLLP